MAKFDELVRAMRIMTRLLAKLRRDGKDRAYAELLEALDYESYVMVGESMPLEATIPITILMLEPAKTLYFAEWIAEKGRPFEDLDSMFPTRKAHRASCTAQEHANGQDILRAYADTLEGLPQTFGGSIRLSHGVNHMHTNRDKTDPVFFCDFRSRLPLAYMFFGKDQAHVLSLVGRENQDRVATWQINAPAFLVDWSPKFAIGFHEESVHPLWQKRYPALVSRGVAGGHGALCMIDHIMNAQARWDYCGIQDVREEMEKSSCLYLAQKDNVPPRIMLGPLDHQEVRFKI